MTKSEDLRKARITMAIETIKKKKNLTDSTLVATICSETGCTWRTAREYVKIARLRLA